MKPTPSFKLLDWLLLLVVFAVAGGARSWYIMDFTDNGDAIKGSYRSAQQGEINEAVKPAAPGYAFVRDHLMHHAKDHLDGKMSPEAAIRWFHVALGTITAGIYFTLARRMFASTLVALLAGLFYALSPLAIISTAELEDGVATSFILGLALAFGARVGQRGGPLGSLLYGICLAALALTRLSLLPFALVAELWFLLRSRTLKVGWLYALLSFLGFGLGLTPWILKNLEETQDPLPIVDTTFWHLWVGNHEGATGGPLVGDGRDVLADRLDQLRDDKRPKRFELLKDDIANEFKERPFDSVERRLTAAGTFFTGKQKLKGTDDIVRREKPRDSQDQRHPLLAVLVDNITIHYVLFGTLFLALIGWRWSYAWRWHSMPLQLALFWIPLPYIIGHAELLHGPRLPLDGALFCLAALTIGCLIPGLRGRLLNGQFSDGEDAVPPMP